MCEQKKKDDYIEKAEPGMLVAFKTEDRMMSAKISKVEKDENGNVLSFAVVTKSGSVFYPTRQEVMWLKTGSRWPKGIFNALKAGRI